MFKRVKLRVVLASVGALGAFTAIWIASATLLVVNSARGRTYTDTSSIPKRHVGLVLGCVRILPGGGLNPFFEYRIRAATDLFRAGKVDYLVVSGDNHIRGYDEPTDMKESLVAAGVPPERIYCDYAGFRTMDSIVRVRKLFGQTSVVVISQEFHNQRAIFLARHNGVDAIGFNAEEVDAYNSFKTKCRELIARANMLLDLYVFRRGPKLLGDKISIPT